MLQILTYFGEASSESGIGALGISGHALIVQLLTFVFAYFVLRKYAFKPILAILAERRETIESGVKLGEEMQKARAELDDQVSAALVDARKKTDAILAQASDAARETVRAAEDKAREKADNIIKDAHIQTEQEASRIRKQIEKEVVSLISDATEVIIGEKLDDKKDAALMDRALKEQRA